MLGDCVANKGPHWQNFNHRMGVNYHWHWHSVNPGPFTTAQIWTCEILSQLLLTAVWTSKPRNLASPPFLSGNNTDGSVIIPKLSWIPEFWHNVYLYSLGSFPKLELVFEVTILVHSWISIIQEYSSPSWSAVFESPIHLWVLSICTVTSVPVWTTSPGSDSYLFQNVRNPVSGN